jgi:glycerate 2-kinase
VSALADLRRDAERIGAAAMRAVAPGPLVRAHLGALPQVTGAVRVLGAGKAAAEMARAVEDVLGERLAGGIVVVPEGYDIPLDRVEVRIAAHPLPDARSEAAGRALLAAAAGASPEDLWIGLWSGGASALIEVPAPGWTLERIAADTRRRMTAGEPIAALNAARRDASAIKGGQLAAAGPGRWWNLVLSDVPGDDPSLVGSGPAIGPVSPAPGPLGPVSPAPGPLGPVSPAPGPLGPVSPAPGPLGPVSPAPGPLGPWGTHRIIGSSRDALEAARAEAFALRYAVVVLDAELSGEARDAGERLARAITALPSPSPPMALLLAGEPVVTGVPPGAVGGRMQELALAAAIGVEGADVAVLALATDGRDGSSDAAGALVDGGTVARGRRGGLDPDAALAHHESTAFLAAAGDLLRPGPTRTNVRDLVVALGAPSGVPTAAGPSNKVP